MPRYTQRVALVIPAYNEEGMIEHVITELQTAFKKTSYAYEIVVIDDGSQDATAQKAEQAGAHVIRHILNTGSGGATATGLSYAEQHSFDIAVTLDADGQHGADDVVKGVKTIENSKSDLLIGSRLIDKRGMSKVKIIGNKGLSFITWMLFGISVTDSQSGLRVFTRKSLTSLRWKTSGYEFCSEMLWRAKQQHLRISEYPIKAIYTDYSQAKGQNNWNGFNIVKSLLRQRVSEFFNE
jgi:glycosyltransferase involved in cell wall biosynthesis